MADPNQSTLGEGAKDVKCRVKIWVGSSTAATLCQLTPRLTAITEQIDQIITQKYSHETLVLSSHYEYCQFSMNLLSQSTEINMKLQVLIC